MKGTVGVSLGDETLTIAYMNNKDEPVSCNFPDNNHDTQIRLCFDSEMNELLGRIEDAGNEAEKWIRKQIIDIRDSKDFASVIKKDFNQKDVHLYTIVILYYQYIQRIIRMYVKDNKVDLIFAVPTNIEGFHIDFLAACYFANYDVEENIVWSAIIYEPLAAVIYHCEIQAIQGRRIFVVCDIGNEASNLPYYLSVVIRQHENEYDLIKKYTFATEQEMVKILNTLLRDRCILLVVKDRECNFHYNNQMDVHYQYVEYDRTAYSKGAALALKLMKEEKNMKIEQYQTIDYGMDIFLNVHYDCCDDKRAISRTTKLPCETIVFDNLMDSLRGFSITDQFSNHKYYTITLDANINSITLNFSSLRNIIISYLNYNGNEKISVKHITINLKEFCEEWSAIAKVEIERMKG